MRAPTCAWSSTAACRACPATSARRCRADLVAEQRVVQHTGEPIALKRLEARPIATLSVEAQERHERMERTRREEA